MGIASRTLAVAAGLLAIAVAAPSSAQELRIGVASETSSIDPHFANLDPNLQVARHLFDHLVTFDPGLRLIPGLAVSWRAVNDTTWEFKLRPGVKWHDGSPFTADDVVFTFERVPDVPNSPSPFRSLIADKKATRVDDLTVQVTTAKPYPLVPNDLSRIAMVSRKHGANATTADYNVGKAAVGTGPYAFVEWVTGDRLVLKANPDFWGGKPRWERVTLKPIKAAPSRLTALLSGDVDVIDEVPPADIAGLKANDKVTVVQTPSNRVIYIGIDSNRDLSPMVRTLDDKPMFPNPLRVWQVRKALSKAIDRQAIVERLMFGAALPAGQMVPEGAFGFNPMVKPEVYDPDGARRLLAQVGLADGFKLTLHGPNDRYVNDEKIIEAIAQMWTRIGVKTDVQAMPGNVFFTRATKLEFSTFLVGATGATGEMSGTLRLNLMTHSPQAGFGPNNRGRYSNMRADGLVEEALITLDDAKREKLLQDASKIFMDDVALIPVQYQIATWAVKRGLTYQGRIDENTLAQGVDRVR